MSDTSKDRPPRRRAQPPSRRRTGADDLLRAYGDAGPVPSLPAALEPDWRAALRHRPTPSEFAWQLVPIRDDGEALLEHLQATYAHRVEPETRRWLASAARELGNARTVNTTCGILHWLCEAVLAPTPRPLPADVRSWAQRIREQLRRFDLRRGDRAVRFVEP